MTDKENVLKVHPRAYAEPNGYPATWYEIVERDGNWSACYGEGSTESLAWSNAAQRLLTSQYTKRKTKNERYRTRVVG